MPDHYPDYPNHRLILEYIRSFADKFSLKEHISFNSEIESASRDESSGIWMLQTKTKEVKAKYLVNCIGVTWIPNIVKFPGQDSFTGEVRHSQTYRSPKEFIGRRVCVVGGGNSGVDIACDAAFAADHSYISLRRGYYFIPKHFFGQPSDVFAKNGPKLPKSVERAVFTGLLKMINGDITRYGLQKPDHKLMDSHPIMNTQILHYLGHGDVVAKPDIKKLDGNQVEFEDGSKEEVDLILTATGYKHSSPYLEGGVLEMKDGRPNLYLNMFARNLPNVAFLGFAEFTSAAYENFHSMAELIVADATDGNVSDKLKEKKANHFPDLKGGHKYINSERHANYIEVESYKKLLKKIKRSVGIKSSVK